MPKDMYATLAQALFASGQRDKAKMPDLTVSIRKAGSSDEVAELINSAWLTYGAGPVNGASFKLNKSEMPKADEGGQLDQFDAAMKYLWFKTGDKGKSRTYAMRGIPYQVQVEDGNDAITVTVGETG